MITKLTPDSSLDKYLKQHTEIFHKEGEHYDLLSTISHEYSGVKIYDIGTYRGLSAIALSSNPRNLVISYDIGYFVETLRPDNVEFRVGNFYHDSEMLNSPLIMFDIEPHDGLLERNFVDSLINQSYKGTVLFDDIHLNDGMKQFWTSVTQEKHDLTHVGHWSGTGIVVFK